MNSDIIKGKWAQFKGGVKDKGGVKEKWGDLTDDDITEIDGQREKLAGKLQERYGWAKDRAEKEIDSYFRDKL